jgi:hypothetical protein
MSSKLKRGDGFTSGQAVHHSHPHPFLVTMVVTMLVVDQKALSHVPEEEYQQQSPFVFPTYTLPMARDSSTTNNASP